MGTFEYISVLPGIFSKKSSNKQRTNLLVREQAGVGILQLGSVIWFKRKPEAPGVGVCHFSCSRSQIMLHLVA